MKAWLRKFFGKSLGYTALSVGDGPWKEPSGKPGYWMVSQNSTRKSVKVLALTKEEAVRKGVALLEREP